MSFLDLVLAILILILMAFSRPTSSNGDAFDRDSTASLRGIAMLGIILHHIHNSLGLCSPILIQVGYIATGLFFFISGYGNMISVNKNEAGIKWIWKKFLKIYVPFFVIYWFFFAGDLAFYRSVVPTETEVIKDLVTMSLPNQASWFPKIIFLCFATHWIARNLSSDTKVQIMAVTLVLCIYCVVMWKLKFAACWYNSVICYAFGMVISEFRGYISTALYEKLNRNIYIGGHVQPFLCWRR